MGDASRSIVLALTVVALATLSSPARAATSGANGTHDPSRLIESGGIFYFCGTGGSCASSRDGLVWSRSGLHIPIPSWAKTYTEVTGYSGNQGIWAPDLIFYKDKFYIYYSFCGQPAEHAPCVVGLYTTPTLDSTAANFQLTDMGKVINNPPNTTGYQFSTIDPAPVIDSTGNLWSSWGSGYGKDQSLLQIFVTRMDANGLPLASDPGYMPPMTLGYGLLTGGIEGSYLHYRDGYYYLFWNSGSCCSGASSTYTVHVARSQSISGPYTGAKVWYSSNGSIHGPGHIGIYSACGVERFTYHYYPDSGGSVLGENDLSWDADGWPIPGAPSTTPLKPCGIGSGGTGGGSGGSADTGGAGGGAGQSSAGGQPSSAGTGGAPAGTSPGGMANGASEGGESSTVAGSGGVVGGSNSAGMSAIPNASAAAGAGVGPTSADAPSAAGCSCSGSKSMSGSKRSQQALWLAGAVLALNRRRKRKP